MIVWIGSALMAFWVFLRLSGNVTRAELYTGVASTLDAFRSPVWLAVVLIATVAGALSVRRRRSAPVQSPLVLSVEIRPDQAVTHVSVRDGRPGEGADVEIPRDAEREAHAAATFSTLIKRSARGAGSGATDPGRLRSELLALGRSVGAMMGAGTKAGEAILDSPATHLLIRTGDDVADLPWELAVLREGSAPIWQQFAIARELPGTAIRPRRSADVRLPLRLLLLADLEAGDEGRALPAASREAEDIMELGAARPDLLRVVRRTPRTPLEFEQLLQGEYDAIHFAGHGGRTDDGRLGWTLPGGVVIAPDAVSPPREAPLLVFSNACAPGTGRGTIGLELAAGFLNWGTRCYVGALWDANDVAGAAFARAFYASLTGGATTGCAIRSAREVLQRFHVAAWANYVLCGDPTVALRSEAAPGI